MKKPDILLLHGAIATENQFDFLTPLLKEEFNCHTLTFSGHGHDITHERFGIAQFADDVLGWMKINKCDKINVFGYSMGGYVAMYLAHYYPEKVNRIFTLATKFDWTPASAQKEAKLLDSKKIEEKIPAFAEILRLKHNDWQSVLKNTAKMMMTMGQSPILTDSELMQINHKVVIGVGDQDTTVSSEVALKTSNILPNSQLLVLPNTPHPFEKVNLKVLTSHIKTFFHS